MTSETNYGTDEALSQKRVATPSVDSDVDVLERASEDQDTVRVTDDVLAINNMWATTDPDQETVLYEDGSFGWQWHREETGVGDPNYPQALVGGKPWGVHGGLDGFPIRRGQIEDFELAVDLAHTIDGGAWNLMAEWWLTEERPGLGRDVSETITHEIALLLDWGDAHDHGDPIESASIEDEYGTVIDYWTRTDPGWNFDIFRVATDVIPERIDLSAIVEYVSATLDVPDDRWIAGVEIGNEYWDDTSGATRFHAFDVTLDGRTYHSGADTLR